MSNYNLTNTQKELLCKLVEYVKDKRLHETVLVTYTVNGYMVFAKDDVIKVSIPDLNALSDERLIRLEQVPSKKANNSYNAIITQRGYDAVSNDFHSPPLSNSNDLKGKVDFAIISVREDEYRAVLKRFPKETIYNGNNRSYIISRVVLANNRSYLVAVVRCIEQGEGHGQDAARDAIEDLDPQWLLLVGIAGGVPAAEFTLGDVVAVHRLTDFSISAAIEERKRQYAVGGGPMHKQVQDRLALLPAMSDELGNWNSKISIGLDKPPVKLIKSNFYGDKDWQKKVREALARHFASSVSPRPPLVTTGAIVSSDTLVKDTQTLQQWQEAARHVLAVEMELGGVYIAARRPNHEYPILAIRGISDIVGFRRHSDWTEYACQSAAAFAHAFIMTKPIEPRSTIVDRLPA